MCKCVICGGGENRVKMGVHLFIGTCCNDPDCLKQFDSVREIVNSKITYSQDYDTNTITIQNKDSAWGTVYEQKTYKRHKNAVKGAKRMVKRLYPELYIEI